MAHRIRTAMSEDDDFCQISGIVEADETYVGGKGRSGAADGLRGDDLEEDEEEEDEEEEDEEQEDEEEDEETEGYSE